MAWINEAHTEWHTVNGQNAVCPLDCGVGEYDWNQCSFCEEYIHYTQACSKPTCVSEAAKYAAIWAAEKPAPTIAGDIWSIDPPF